MPDTQRSTQHPLARVSNSGSAQGLLLLMEARGQNCWVGRKGVGGCISQGQVDECIECWVRGKRGECRGRFSAVLALGDGNVLSARGDCMTVALLVIRLGHGARSAT